MRRLIFAAFAAALICAFLCGCGGSRDDSRRVPVPPPPAAPQPQTLTFAEPSGSSCVTRNPPSAGECVNQALKAEEKLPTLKSKGAYGDACADWSVYQGYYPVTTGLHCVIVQASYGGYREPSVSSQISDLRAHGTPYGVYNFAEPGVSGGYEFRVTRALVPDPPLGYWTDVEVAGAFWRSCEFTEEARAYHERIYGVFSYPGGYAAGGGHYCPGAKLWPSEWGVPGPYAFGGFPASAIVLWQDCGTCSRYGVETDLDVDEGLIALGTPPKPKPAPTPAQIKAKEHRQLNTDYRLRSQLRLLIGRPPGHECRPGDGHHVTPDTRPYRHACDVWLNQGQQVDAQIESLHRHGIF